MVSAGIGIDLLDEEAERSVTDNKAAAGMDWSKVRRFMGRDGSRSLGWRCAGRWPE